MRISNPIGKKGQDAAAHFLHAKGYSVVEMNYRKNYTEIDIIATKDNVLVFVEVKTRTSGAFDTSFEVITKEKIKKLIKAAHQYKNAHPKLPTQMRIDAIGIIMDENKIIKNIEHVENISGF